mmetsp:Transcript_118688/g.242643  ORF Transcript_118688/g.242643 Transcript_118688/m.242643 type:complete len:102 (-) Transcript_118688:180-485(-)
MGLITLLQRTVTLEFWVLPCRGNRKRKKTEYNQNRAFHESEIMDGGRSFGMIWSIVLKIKFRYVPIERFSLHRIHQNAASRIEQQPQSTNHTKQKHFRHFG